MAFKAELQKLINKHFPNVTAGKVWKIHKSGYDFKNVDTWNIEVSVKKKSKKRKHENN